MKVNIYADASAVVKWILQRGSWSIRQATIGVLLYGETGTARHVTATILGAKLPRGIADIVGGLWYERGPCREEILHENRAQELALWATRALRNTSVEVTLDWGKQHPAASSFGRETLASFGMPAALEHIARCDALYVQGKFEDANKECAAFAARFTPVPEWAPEDRWDRVPSRAPAWAS